MENISVKEIMIAIAVLAISMAIAILCFQPIQDRIETETILYQQSLKVDAEPEIFSYAKETNIGNVLAYGKMISLDNQTLDDIIGEYSIIHRTKEKYTRHTREVKKCDSNGNNCRMETEVYYTWDTVSSLEKRSSSYNFLGVEMNDASMNLRAEISLYPASKFMSSSATGRVSGKYHYPNGGGDSVGNIRYYYSALPTEFMSTVFVRFFENRITSPLDENGRIKVNCFKTIEETVESQENKIVWISAVYYIVWFLATTFLYFYLAYKYFEIY